jgi:hypothetical protein
LIEIKREYGIMKEQLADTGSAGQDCQNKLSVGRWTRLAGI